MGTPAAGRFLSCLAGKVWLPTFLPQAKGAGRRIYSGAGIARQHLPVSRSPSGERGVAGGDDAGRAAPPDAGGSEPGMDGGDSRIALEAQLAAASLFNESGLRPLERLQLRVKDLDLLRWLPQVDLRNDMGSVALLGTNGQDTLGGRRIWAAGGSCRARASARIREPAGVARTTSTNRFSNEPPGNRHQSRDCQERLLSCRSALLRAPPSGGWV
jgi:hypothetical protein